MSKAPFFRWVIVLPGDRGGRHGGSRCLSRASKGNWIFLESYGFFLNSQEDQLGIFGVPLNVLGGICFHNSERLFQSLEGSGAEYPDRRAASSKWKRSDGGGDSQVCQIPTH